MKLKNPLLLTSTHVIQQRCSEREFLAVNGIPQILMCSVNKGTVSNSMRSDVLAAGCVDEDSGLLGCADMSLGEYCLTCQRNVVSSSSKVDRSQKN